MTTNYGERPGLTVDSGAVNADGVDMSGFMAVLHDAGTDECGNVTVSSGLWSRIKCEHYAALAEIAGLRRRKFTPVPTDGEGWIMHSVPAQVADYAAALVSERDAARAEAARLRAALESANAGYLRACAERNGYRIALERIANAPCDTFHGPTDYCPALEARIALGCETEAGKDGAL